jgi:hypothetical protein
MWFALGDYAQKSTSPQFVDLKKRMAGRRLAMDDAEDLNNAFVMRIGPLLVIEFGVTNNACYIFPASEFRPDLNRLRHSIHTLKQKTHATRLSHSHQWERRFDEALLRLLQQTPASKGVMRQSPAIPSGSTAAPVQVRSARMSGNEVAPSQTVPAVRAAETSRPNGAPSVDFDTLIEKVKHGCERHKLEFQDNLTNGGAFWVLMRDPTVSPGYGRLLEANGFRFAAGRGYWIRRS